MKKRLITCSSGSDRHSLWRHTHSHAGKEWLKVHCQSILHHCPSLSSTVPISLPLSLSSTVPLFHCPSLPLSLSSTVPLFHCPSLPLSLFSLSLSLSLFLSLWFTNSPYAFIPRLHMTATTCSCEEECLDLPDSWSCTSDCFCPDSSSKHPRISEQPWHGKISQPATYLLDKLLLAIAGWRCTTPPPRLWRTQIKMQSTALIFR